MTADTDILMIGGGFCATMVAFHLAQSGVRALQISTSPDDVGAAYATPHASHLLNVRADRMGALPDDEKHFYAWLQSLEGQDSLARHVPGFELNPNRFVPRVVYGDYIRHFARQAKVTRIIGKAVSAASDGNGLRVSVETEGTTTDIRCRRLVVASGLGELSPGFAPLALSGYDFISTPMETLQTFLQTQAHLLIIGTGLTSVDALLTLEDAGFTGKITVASRHALFPARHPDLPAPPIAADDKIRSQTTALGLLTTIREAAARAVLEGKDWQQAIAGLRPHTQAIWQNLPVKEQKRVFKKLFTLWNIHRHQMAPEIAMRLKNMQRSKRISVLHAGVRALTNDGNGIVARFHSGESISVTGVLDCTGPSYRRWLTEDPLLSSLQNHGLITPHATGVGVAVDAALRASKQPQPPVYVLGALVTGQLLESTAVPELRGQAASVANALLGR